VTAEKKTEVCKCDLQIPVTLPSEGEFTLTAFGLPEPTWMVKKPMRWYLWVALAGIISLALAALFRWKARRAEGTAENPQP
jgi:hypothetical protein